jgi:hypothetical protein
MSAGRGAGAPSRLKLRALDEEDLAVVSANLQDAIAPVGDMAWLAEERAFVLVVNRFMWEAEALEDDPFEADEPLAPIFHRVNCAVRFEGVTGVRYRDFDPKDRGRLLSLLALEADPGAPGAVMVLFAGGAALRIEVERLDCRLEDIGSPWPTTRRPAHALDDDPPRT